MTKHEKLTIESKSDQILKDLIRQKIDFFTIELIVEECNEKLRNLIKEDSRN